MLNGEKDWVETSSTINNYEGEYKSFKYNGQHRNATGFIPMVMIKPFNNKTDLENFDVFLDDIPKFT